jgi:hypothetical protein
LPRSHRGAREALPRGLRLVTASAGDFAMPKARKSNKEVKKKPAKTMKEKRAAKKSKGEEVNLMGADGKARKPNSVADTRRP